VKRSIASFLIILQLALQVGIPIHKHFCEMDGAFASVVLKIDHKCAQTHEELPPCCQKEQTAACDANLQEKDCCSDEFQVVKTHMDQVCSSFEWQYEQAALWPSFHSISSFVNLDIQPKTNPPSGQTYRPPPLYKSGKQIQVKNQVWQI
jgi:hypothetical protein